MKKLFLSMAIVATGVFAMAQEAKIQIVESSSMPMGKKKKGLSQDERLAKLKTELNLSDGQVAQIKTLEEKNKAERVEAMKSAKENRSEMNKAMKEKRMAEMKAIFTPEQFAKWEANKAKKQSTKK